MKMNPDTKNDEYAEFVEKHSDDILKICAISGTSAWELCEALRDLGNKLAETGKQIEETLKPLLENPPEARNLYLLMLKRNIRTLSERQAAITKDNGKRG